MTTVAAGATLQLPGRQSNGDGIWWFVGYEQERGWAPQAALQP